MKKIISFLVSISFISFLSFGSLFAREEVITKTEPTTVIQTPEKIGLNLKIFLGTGKLFGNTSVAKDNIGSVSYELESKFSLPQFALGVSYNLFHSLEIGLTFYRNNFTKITENPKVTVIHDLGIDGVIPQHDNLNIQIGNLENRVINDLQKTLSQTIGTPFSDLTFTQLAVSIIYNFNLQPVIPYLGIDLFPFIKSNDMKKETVPSFAISGLVGAKYNINDTVNLLTQVSYEITSGKSDYFQDGAWTLNIDILQILFGVGVSL